MQTITTTIGTNRRQENIDTHESRLFSNNGNNSNQNDGSDGHLRHVLSLPLFTSRASSDMMGRELLRPPIALLSREHRQDPAVIRLQVALARSDIWDSQSNSPEEGPLLSETTTPTLSPKISRSLGYDDDAASSPFSTPTRGASSVFLRRHKSRAAHVRSSSVISASSEESDSAQHVTEPTSFTVESSRPTNCHWMLRQNQQHVYIMDKREEQESQLNEKGAVSNEQDLSFVVTNAHEGLGTSNNSDSAVSTMTVPVDDDNNDNDTFAAGQRELSKNEKEEEEENGAGVSCCYDDDVLGVTAEGEFIYRRDITTKGGVNHQDNYQQRHERRYVLNDGVSANREINSGGISSISVMDTIFFTPEKSIFSTVLSGRLRDGDLDEEGNVDEENKARYLLTTLQPNRRSSLSRGVINHSGYKNTVTWTPSDVEKCNLLFQYHTRENAGAVEYQKLVSVVSDWRARRCRYPNEALERRLQEGDSYDRPPFILRW